MRCLLTALLVLAPAIQAAPRSVFQHLWSAASSTPVDTDSWNVEVVLTDTGQQFSIVYDDTVNFQVDWGDGSVSNINDGPTGGTVYHTYADAGTNVVQLSGGVSTIKFGSDAATRRALTRVLNPVNGITGLTSFSQAFGTVSAGGCTNLVWLPTDMITGASSDLSLVNSVVQMFAGATGVETFPDLYPLTLCASLDYTWYGCSSAVSFPEVNALTNVNSMYETYRFVASCKVFPDVDQLNLVTRYFRTWHSCSAITNVPALVSNSDVLTDAQGAFFGCNKMGGTVVELWNTNLFPNLTGYVNTFDGCTNLANWADVPAGWR